MLQRQTKVIPNSTFISQEVKTLQYFYLSDHLGSSSWISDKDGNALQHLSYLPFGEVFANQKAQNSNFDTEYKFLGKELDAETGYIATDFRYYDPRLGVFLSVDPMASERSWVSPYNYSQNNPINRSDPTGLLDDKYFNESGKYLGDDGVGNNIRIMSQSQFNMLTDNGQENLTEIEGVLKQSSSLLTDYISGQDNGLQDNLQMNIYQHFNPTDLSLEKDASIEGNIGFSYNTKGKNLMLKVNLEKNMNYVDNYDNVINMFEHEKNHYEEFKKFGVDKYRTMSPVTKEQNAINHQINHGSWKNTSQNFKDGVKRYGIKNGIKF